MAWVTPTDVDPGDAILASLYNQDVVANTQFLFAPPTCIVRRTTGLSWSVNTDIAWSSAAVDTDSMFDSGAATRVTIKTAGLYMVQIHADVRSTSAFTSFTWRIAKNGTTQMNAGVVALQNPRYNAAWLIPMAPNDYFTLQATWDGGGTVTLNGDASTGQDQSRMTVVWISNA